MRTLSSGTFFLVINGLDTRIQMKVNESWVSESILDNPAMEDHSRDG